MKIKKFFVITHFFLLLFFILAVFKPTFFYWSLLPVNLILFFISYRIISLRLDKSFIKYLILPILFINASFFYGSLLAGKFLFILFLLLAVFLLFFSYRSAVKYYFIESDRKKNLPLWSNLFGFLTVFLSSSFVYSLPYFMKIESWLLVLILSIIVFISFFQNIAVEKMPIKIDLFFSFLFLFSMVPLLWALLLMPFNYNILGLLASLFYYSALNFVVFYLKKDLTVKKVRYNLLFTFLLLLIILLGARWK